MSDPNEEFCSLSDAFCSRYRCQPDDFVRKAFWKTLPAKVWIPAMLIGGPANERFHQDLEILASLAEAQSPEDLNHAIDDLLGVQDMDRSRLRRWFGIRVSAMQIRELMSPLLAKVRRSPAPAIQAPVSRPQSSQTSPAPVKGSAESATQRLRQAMRIHAAIIVGTPLPQMLASEYLTLRQLQEFLSEYSNLRPEMTFLRTYLREQEELTRLREQAGPNNRFKAP
jgi:hypothetical protein